jgi:hypothetical protein
MDEILDRIKAIKIKRKYLIISLISTEIFGIIVLIWFLRIPLSQKFLTVPPKAYSVVTLNPEKRYLVSQGDFLRGQAIPNTRVKVLVTPGNIKSSVNSSSTGEWNYQIPENFPIGIYRFTFGNFDKSNKLVTFQSYKFRVQSNISIYKFINPVKKMLGFIFEPQFVYAQANILDSNYYSNLYLPTPGAPVELTGDEKYRLEKYFLPYAYSAAQMKNADWRLMAMWVFIEDYITNYMDNCLDGNKNFGEDADLNQNTTCTGWVNSQLGVAPNWQVGWGIFPWMGIDYLEEAIAVMRPGESIQEIGQQVIDESRDEDRYTKRGLVFFKPPNDPITNPEIFPDDVTLEQIIEGAKPLGDDTDRSKTCRPDDRAHADPFQDPKDCQMRQLLGILMKDPAISAYLLAIMWHDTLDRGNLATTLKTWGPPDKNPYSDLQRVSNTIAAMSEFTSELDLEALKATPKITIPIAVASTQDPVYPIDGVQVETVISQGGNALNAQDVTDKNLRIEKVIIPYGTNPQDFICNDTEQCEHNPTPENNVRGISTINAVAIESQVSTNPSGYQLCALLQPVGFDVIIDYSCIPLEQIIDPSAPQDTITIHQTEPSFEDSAPTSVEFIQDIETIEYIEAPVIGPEEPQLESENIEIDQVIEVEFN